MCGINGLLSLDHNPISDGEMLVNRMNNAIAHRGPDDSGIYIHPDNHLILGHRRLSIIDLSPTGHQPMKDEYGNYIVFNGEIYNYNEIKANNPNIQFKSESDTEVLLKLFREKGEASLKELNGMFAFAFWRVKDHQLTLVRDRAGKKPVYYTVVNNVFAFSSEIKALLTLPWINAEIDNQALYDFLTFNQLSAPATMFKNIYKLDTAELLTINAGGQIEKRNYWNINYQDISKQSESEIKYELLSKLEKSVKYRMVSDVPVGAFLSGGVDSSAVVSLMRKNNNGVIKTFSVGFDDQPEYDERIFARRVADIYNTEHFEKVVTRDEIRHFLSHIVDIFDEPMADSTCIPIYFISKMAKEQGTIVVQTGDGADELFAGYRNWQKYIQCYPLFDFFSNMPLPIKQLTGRIFKAEKGDAILDEMLNRAANKQAFFWGGAKAFKENNKRQFLNSEWLKTNSPVNSYHVIEERLEKFKKLQKQFKLDNHTDWMCYYGFREIVPWLFLYRMDRIGMAHSIEVRCPFLDYELVEYALSIPSNLKIKNNEPKYILKKALEPLLGNEILYRKKKGFCVPLKEWGEDIMVDYISDTIPSFCRITGIFNQELLFKLIDDYKLSKTGTNQLWTIYFLMQWYNKWMN